MAIQQTTYSKVRQQAFNKLVKYLDKYMVKKAKGIEPLSLRTVLTITVLRLVLTLSLVFLLYLPCTLKT